MVIEMKSVNKSYRNGAVATQALKDVSLEIRRGEFVAVIGPSGSGKSTLMNLIGCLDRADSGIFRLDGRDTGTLSDDELAETRNRKIGFVFQSFHLLAQYSALENVELAMLYGGTSQGEAREKARAVLTALGMQDRMDHRPNQLSGGQKQRVAIARALVNSPAIILADEPTGNLDTTTGSEVLSIFRELNRQGATVVVVTHDRDIAANARRAVSIRDGIVREL